MEYLIIALVATVVFILIASLVDKRNKRHNFIPPNRSGFYRKPGHLDHWDEPGDFTGRWDEP